MTATIDIGEAPPLNEQKVEAILQEALSHGYFELDVDGNLPRDYKDRERAALELIRQCRLSYAAGNKADGIQSLLFIAEVDLNPAQANSDIGGSQMAATAEVDLSAHDVPTLKKFEETLLNYDQSNAEVQQNLALVRAEIAKKGGAPASAPTNGATQEPTPPPAAVPVPEPTPSAPSVDRAALENQITFGIMRAHGIDPSDIPSMTNEQLQWVISHPGGNGAQESAPATPAPVAAPPEPQEQPQTIETTRMVVPDPEPQPTPQATQASAPEPSQATPQGIDAEREELESQVTGPMLKCVAKGEQVLMADGSRKAIESIEAGDMVMSSDGQRTQFDVVSDRWFAGEKEVLQITLSDGRRIRVTPEHRVFGWNDWVLAGSLQEGDPVCVPLATDLVPGVESISLDDAFLLALWLAEGLKNLKKYRAFRYTSDMDEIHARVDEIALRRGWLTSVYARDIDRAITRGDNRGRDFSAVAMLYRHGLEDALVDTIFVPDAVLRGTPEVVAEFLSTYIACDGCVKMGTERGVVVTSASERLCRDLQILAARLGVRSTVHYVGTPPSRRNYRPTWNWSVAGIGGICKLADVLHIPGKQMLLDDLAAGIRGRRQHGGVVPSDFCDDLVVKSPRGFRQRESTGSWLTEEKAVALLEHSKNSPVAEPLLAKLGAGLGWARVMKVESGGVVETFDLETARHHAFFLEGALTHNSYGRGRVDVPEIGINELRFMIQNPEGRVTQEQLLAARALDEGGESTGHVPTEEESAQAGEAVAVQKPGIDPLAQVAQEIQEGDEAAKAALIGELEKRGFQTEQIDGGTLAVPPVAPQRVTKAQAFGTEPPANPAQEIIDRENLPVPEEIEGKPPRMPNDMSKCSDEEIMELHARFHACASRASYLVGLWEGEHRDVSRLRRGEEVRAANNAPTKDPDDSRKRLTDAQRESLVAADPEVMRLKEEEHKIERVLRQLKALRDTYMSDVSACSRQWTMRHREAESAGGLR